MPKDENSMKKDAETNDETSLTDGRAWLNPANGRKTPYVGEEPEQFVDAAISNMDDGEAWNNLAAEHGEKKAREILKEDFGRMYERNLVNVETKEPPE
jgi:hypothetical protein